MRDFLKAGLANLGKVLPLKVTKLPYKLALDFITKKADSFKVSAWPRNSYLTSAFHPLKSDLDITFWFEGDLDWLIIKKLCKSYSRAKLIFPLLGEVSFHSNFSKKLALMANFFEIHRDPLLCKKLNLGDESPSREEAIIFLAKMLEADYNNLQVNSSHRAEKWKDHFSIIHEYFDSVDFPSPLSVDEISKSIVRMINQENSSSEIIHYLEAWKYGKNLNSIQVSPLLWSLFPNRFCFLYDQIDVLKPPYNSIFVISVEWELWGLLSQIHNASQLDIEHLERIEKTVDRALKGSDISKATLKHNIRLLIDLISTMLRTS